MLKKNEVYFYIGGGEAGATYFEVIRTKAALLERIKEDTIDVREACLPVYYPDEGFPTNPMYWKPNSVIIIKGRVVLPFPKTRVTEYDIE